MNTQKHASFVLCLIQQSVSTEAEIHDIVEEYFAVSWTELKLIIHSYLSFMDVYDSMSLSQLL